MDRGTRGEADTPGDGWIGGVVPAMGGGVESGEVDGTGSGSGVEGSSVARAGQDSGARSAPLSYFQLYFRENNRVGD